MHETIPGLTAAEADLLEHYVRILELLGRLNPARTASTVHGCLVGQALVSEARALHAALASMQSRGQDEVFHHVLSRALRHLQADRHLARLHLLD
jgi:hypothetical protein